MRQFIGHRPLLLCGASVILFNDIGQVLMEQRSDNKCWCFPGGGIELGEKVEDAATREVLEETGLIVTNLSIFGIYSGEELHYTYPNGDEVYIIDIVFTSSTFKGEVTISNESKCLMFFDIDKIPDEISPPVIPIVRDLQIKYAAQGKILPN
ncbi:NUDIX hydrolase [Paenibacillus mucilaginosus]|nr:NUDIX hydrolase [Paenibacillus mucilaginosus]